MHIDVSNSGPCVRILVNATRTKHAAGYNSRQTNPDLLDMPEVRGSARAIDGLLWPDAVQRGTTGTNISEALATSIFTNFFLLLPSPLSQTASSTFFPIRYLRNPAHAGPLVTIGRLVALRLE